MHLSIRVPAEGIENQSPSRREKLHVTNCDVGARDRIAARQAHGRAPYIVGPLDIRVLYVGHLNGRGAIRAVLGEAVELVDDDRIPHVLHVDLPEGHARDSPGPALPRFDPYPVVGILDHRVAHRYVGGTRARVVLAQAPYAVYLSHYEYFTCSLYMIKACILYV